MVPNLKIREMAKVTRNSGKFQQDATISMLARDARGTQNSTAVAQGLKQGQAKADYAAKQEAPTRVSFKFLATGK
jgi:hypothetical protein